VEFSYEAFSLLHDLPRIGLSVFQCDSASEHQPRAVFALKLKQALFADRLTSHLVMEFIVEQELRIILKGLLS
jgi:hypothetical protein